MSDTNVCLIKVIDSKYLATASIDSYSVKCQNFQYFNFEHNLRKTLWRSPLLARLLKNELHPKIFVPKDFVREAL